MDAVSLGLTPRGHLVLSQDAEPPHIEGALAERLTRAFERGSGNGLLLLGADETGTALPPVHSFWRDFGVRYVTALCGQADSDAPVPAPSGEELEGVASAAPPMAGAEYLTAAVLQNLWQELDGAFRIELAESKSGVQDFLRR